MQEEIKYCSECEMPLIKLDWNSRVYLFVCDNLDCGRYRQPQGNERKLEVSWVNYASS